jgi:hypothetical protein
MRKNMPISFSNLNLEIAMNSSAVHVNPQKLKRLYQACQHSRWAKLKQGPKLARPDILY